MASSLQRLFLELQRGLRRPLQPPCDVDRLASQPELAAMKRTLTWSCVGTGTQVQEFIRVLAARTSADELMVATPAFDVGRRLRSYEIVAEALAALG